MVMACPSRYNVYLWAAMSQAFNLVAASTRHLRYERQKAWIKCKGKTVLELIFRARRYQHRFVLVDLILTLLSYVLNVYGTVVLASMMFIPASDAIRAMVVITISAGLGRLVCWLSLSGPTTYIRCCVLDMDELLSATEKQELESRVPATYSCSWN